MDVSEMDTGSNKAWLMTHWEAMLFLVALLLVVLGFFAAVAQWSQIRAEPVATAPQPAVPADTGNSAFEYFPGQYVNQATRVEEPIQAF